MRFRPATRFNRVPCGHSKGRGCDTSSEPKWKSRMPFRPPGVGSNDRYPVTLESSPRKTVHFDIYLQSPLRWVRTLGAGGPTIHVCVREGMRGERERGKDEEGGSRAARIIVKRCVPRARCWATALLLMPHTPTHSGLLPPPSMGSKKKGEHCYGDWTRFRYSDYSQFTAPRARLNASFYRVPFFSSLSFLFIAPFIRYVRG